MSTGATVWRLSDPSGMPVQCLIRERDGGWLLLIRRGCEITLAERCRSDDAALRRADEIWRGFKERGFTEQRH